MNPILIPKEPLRLLSMLWAAGFRGYAVGGCVRDSLLGLPPKDWDLCTDALPEQMQQVFANEHTIPTGLKHGTLTVLAQGVPYEVTTFRVDGSYTDSRHPDSVRFVSDVRMDLARRDFTVNAMAFHPSEGLIDAFGGQKDLSDRVLRCVGDPAERFAEDGLRVMRALRFSAVYGLTPEPETDKAIRESAGLLAHVSQERIFSELCKLLTGPHRLPILLSFPEIICEILPELRDCVGFEQRNPHHRFDVYTHIMHAVNAYPGKDLSVLLCLLLHDCGKPEVFTMDERGGHFYRHAEVSRQRAGEALNRLKCSRAVCNQALELILSHDTVLSPTEKCIRRWLGRLGEEQFLRLLDVHEADIRAQASAFVEERLKESDAIRALTAEILARGDCFSLKTLAVNGKMLMEAGFPEGKKVGNELRSLLDRVMSGKLPNDREALLETAKRDLN